MSHYPLVSKYMKKVSSQKGFTLIEMLVSVALFTIVMTVGLGVILSVVEGNKKTQSINSVVNNLNSSIDSMVRDMKTGLWYKCDANLPVLPGVSTCTDSSVSTPVLSFISTISGGERSVSYHFVPSNINGTPGYIEKTSCSAAGVCDAVPTRITSPEVNITDMRMYVKSGLSGVDQPGILLIIGGTAKINPATVSNFYLQTFVSRRVLNI